MKHILMMMIAVICGVIAFGCNYFYLSQKGAPTYYVTVKTAVKRNDPLTPEAFGTVAIHGDAKTAAIPASEVATLYNRLAQRDLGEGELVLWQDVTPPNAVLQLKPDETGLHIGLESLNIEPGLLQVGDSV